MTLNSSFVRSQPSSIYLTIHDQSKGFLVPTVINFCIFLTTLDCPSYEFPSCHFWRWSFVLTWVIVSWPDPNCWFYSFYTPHHLAHPPTNVKIWRNSVIFLMLKC